MYCSECGTKVPDNSLYCSNCGINIDEQRNKQEVYYNSLFPNDNPIESKSIKTHKLLGFRSNKIWKKVLSIIYFIGTALFLLGVFVTTDDCDYTSKDKILTKISYLFMFLALVLPYVWLSDLLSIKIKMMRNGKKGIVILIAVLLAILPLFASIAPDAFKSEEYKAAYIQEQEKERIKEEKKKTTEKKTTAEKTTKRKEKTMTSTSTTVDNLHDNVVDANEETMLMSMCEDIGKRLSNYPSTVKFDTMSWTFEQDGLKYTTCSTFECQNAYGVKEKHILVVIAETDEDGSAINPVEICVDGEMVNIY